MAIVVLWCAGSRSTAGKRWRWKGASRRPNREGLRRSVCRTGRNHQDQRKGRRPHEVSGGSDARGRCLGRELPDRAASQASAGPASGGGGRGLRGGPIVKALRGL